ncbi:hypothetical protein BGX34_001482 [Mortierella sp. NVP85]|nr:hypothetical protein BGX34_001482 [Mortierella sp. NVP85]
MFNYHSRQIDVSTVSNGRAPTADEIEARYLTKWRPVLITTIVLGLRLSFIELDQMGLSWILTLDLAAVGPTAYSLGKYFRSPFNYVNLAAYSLPVAGCFMFLNTTPGTIQADIGIDGGPSQIWPMGFGILFLYLNMLFELRIIPPLAKVVDIIITITQRIKWFFLVFAVFLVSFTHAFLYVLHTRRYRPCEGDSCKETDYPSSYPTNFLEALMATYFFLSGRYDPVESSIENGSVTFRVMMVVFFFFTVIILLNVLIALVNDAFNESGVKHTSSYWKFIADEVAVVEMRIGVDISRPRYIYYCEYDHNVEKFEETHSVSRISKHSENRFVAESSRESHTETPSTLYAIHQHMAEMQRENRELKQELADLKGDVKPSCRHDRLEREIAELRELVERPPGHEELKRELAELKSLIEGLVLQRSNNTAA